MKSALTRISVVAAFAAGIVMCLSLPAQAAGVPAAQKQAEELAIQGLDLSDKGDFAGAVDKFRQALTLDPKDKGLKQNLAEQLTNLGISLYNAKDYAGAAAKLDEAVTLAPKLKSAKDNLAFAQGAIANNEGNILYKAGDVAAAKAKYAESVGADPTNIGAKANLATAEADLLEKAGDIDSLTAAVAKRQEAATLVPDKLSLKQKVDEAQAALTAAQTKKAEEDAKNKK